MAETPDGDEERPPAARPEQADEPPSSWRDQQVEPPEPWEVPAGGPRPDPGPAPRAEGDPGPAAPPRPTDPRPPGSGERPDQGARREPPGLPSYPSGPPSYPSAPPSYPSGGAQTWASPYVGFWPRVGGWLIDYILLGAVGAAVQAAFRPVDVGRWTFHITDTSTRTVTVYHLSIIGLVLQALIVIAYGTVLCGSSRGQTLGMIAIRARAADADRSTPIGYGRALGRAVFEYLLFIVAVLPWVLDMLWASWDPRHQTLHDKVTGTVVVRPEMAPR